MGYFTTSHRNSWLCVHSIPSFIGNDVISTHWGYVKWRVNTFLHDSDQMNPHTALYHFPLVKGNFLFLCAWFIKRTHQNFGGFLFRLYLCSSTLWVAMAKNNVGQKSHFPNLRYMKTSGSCKPKYNCPWIQWRFMGIWSKACYNSVKTAACG